VNLFYQPLIDQGIRYLDDEESRHVVRVLRRKNGDPLLITDGKGIFYDAVITRDDPHRCTFDIRQERPEPSKNFSIHIAISPTKNADRIEWFVEKSVEFGIDAITLLECDHTERSFSKTDRLKKIAVSAMKQSLKAFVPTIRELTSFTTFVPAQQSGQRFIAHVDSENPHLLMDKARPAQACVVLIGPEGDFSSDELTLAAQHGFQKVSLGPSRLRTETAGMAACHILNLVNR
jgi:16S rRNA (uracil1498-N3)-methyltransferase